MQNNPPPARLLDVTRLSRRAERIPTGIDRVELAYLQFVLSQDIDAFGLIRSSLGYILLDRAGLELLQAHFVKLGTQRLDGASLEGKQLSKKSLLKQLRKNACVRVLPFSFEAMLKKQLPRHTHYLNVGHSNITKRVFSGVRNAIGAKIFVLIHDVIPLDFPHFQRNGTVEKFRDKLKLVQSFADVLIYNSMDTKEKTENYFTQWGTVPFGAVSHLGVELSEADQSFERPEKPYFVYVSTIEPRKNHAFLLDLWEKLADPKPQLYFCGARGWKNTAVFDRLDALPSDHPIMERNDLNDAQIAALVKGANGVLFPSFAEGFGMPVIEAAMFSTPVLCNDLKVMREIVGERAIYLNLHKPDEWIAEINKLVDSDASNHRVKQKITFDWAKHFHRLENLI